MRRIDSPSLCIEICKRFGDDLSALKEDYIDLLTCRVTSKKIIGCAISFFTIFGSFLFLYRKNDLGTACLGSAAFTLIPAFLTSALTAIRLRNQVDAREWTEPENFL